MISIVEVTSECGMRLKYWKRRSTEELLWVEIHLKWGGSEKYWGREGAPLGPAELCPLKLYTPQTKADLSSPVALFTCCP